ncbi:heparinase [Brevibacillus sp. LEMMJ03]|uniref:alginate lyase family protein n=1 Tax=Brevibacillus sp. LEMMJ03 TaxID=2595056 RepID=UPI001180D6E6|nr:alginate lyase family protein [Brevibacillus sp. LEMMJ03]TRY27513.1 heparinase [Brevibacillus sp. LEMMJ03]
MAEHRSTPAFFWSEQDREYLAAACRSHWPQEVAEVLKRADLACENTFVFTHRWDMERCDTPVSFPGRIDWTYRLNGDFEWTVMLNRARYMAELGQAYWLTGDEKYAAGFVRLMTDWLAQNPLTEEEVHASRERFYNVKDTWRKLDSGIRIVNWIKGYYCVRTSPAWGRDEERLFWDALRLHGMYLHIAYVPHDRQSNWGFLETNGLFQIGLLFPALAEAQTWLSAAVERLAAMVRLQVFEDGMHNEQSPMYHHEVLQCLFECVWLAEKNGLAYPDELKRTLYSMYTASLALLKPNGHQPMASDSDDTDIRDILCQGAVLFGRGDLKSQAYPVLDYQGIWYFGREGVDAYERLPAEPPAFASVHLEQAGYIAMRSGWSPDAHYLLFDAGHMALTGKAHGHDDLLHIELSAHGREFLVDAGRYTYMENDERRYFKEAFQHNVVTVDGLPVSAYIDSWQWGRTALPLDRYCRIHEAYAYAQAGHDGYLSLSRPVQVLRRILYVPPDCWIVVDTFRSDGAHGYAQHFHFAEDVPLRIDQETGTARTAFSEGGNLTLMQLGRGRGEWTMQPCWISRHYNQKRKATKLVYRQVAHGFHAFVTILTTHLGREEAGLAVRELEVRDTRDSLLDAEQVTALEIRREGRSAVALFSHQGPDSYQFAGTHMSGEVMLIRREAGQGEHAYVVKV